METYVLMIVWNGIQNDSRVQKSAKSLFEAGYKVTLYGIATKGEPLAGRFDGFEYQLVKLISGSSINSNQNQVNPGSTFRLKKFLATLQRAAFQLGQKSKTLKAIFGRIALEKYSSIAARKIVESTSDIKFDFLHVHDYTALPLAKKILADYRFADVKLIYDAHEYLKGTIQPPKLLKYFVELETEIINKSTGVVTVCDPIADQLKLEFPSIKDLAVVRNTPVSHGKLPNWHTIRDVVGLDDAIPLIVYSGGVSRLRGLGTFLAALEYLPNFHAVVVAPSADAVKSFYPNDASELQKRIHVLPFVPQEQVPYYLSSADVAVHPLLKRDKGKVIINHEWALPNKWFEYIQAGLPVVVSDVEYMGKLIKETRNGATFESGNPKDLADKINLVYKNRKEFRQAITDQVIEEADWSVDAKALINLYEELDSRSH